MFIRNLQTFLEILNENKNGTINIKNQLLGLQLNMSGTDESPERCAESIALALEMCSDNFPLDLHLDFSLYSFSIQPIARVIAEFLQQGRYPRGIKIDFGKNKSCDQAVALLFAKALQSGQCRQQLSIALMNVGDEGITALMQAITSGKCPDGLHLDISNFSINEKHIESISLALQNDFCPNNLHLSILDRDKIAASYLAKAFLSGKCKPGLKVDLQGDGDNAAIIMSTVFKSGKLPSRFYFQFAGVSDKGALILAEALEEALNNGNLPFNFRICIIPDSEIKEGIMRYIMPNTTLIERIFHVFEENNIQHAAKSCLTLQQGSRQSENLLSILPQEMLNNVYSYVFASATCLFFKKVEKKQKYFINNIENFFNKNSQLK